MLEKDRHIWKLKAAHSSLRYSLEITYMSSIYTPTWRVERGKQSFVTTMDTSQDLEYESQSRE